ncbi:hypothetical protein DAPPUDRAFT_305361 [Daphnia pulex]|uniref:Chitin-binding type-1 domain-containing protein n=1 Tax=Daphnia pulex TaxID=6669 RepID=E9GSA9_DAPPU|nr:hypothetical protein DAPPUDRAFT_305361 [Daphnia pulex]|eukprot:EFX77702.1 hypothetical protein DAPPUDRAFT_305361 [Daphnia pulex]
MKATILLILTVSAIISTEPQFDVESNSVLVDSTRCGPRFGRCARGLCCGLNNECGSSVAHCNVSLGCKSKWGICF